jgi:hypothetical protein
MSEEVWENHVKKGANGILALLEKSKAELDAAQARIAELEKQLAKLNIILYHRENGLSHPDLQGEIDKSKLTEQLEAAKDAIDSIWPFIKEDFPKGTGENHGTCAADDYRLAAQKIEAIAESGE